MDNETLQALKGSIAKWQHIADGSDIDEGPQNCPLCKMYFYFFRGETGNRLGPTTKSCTGCPVRKKSVSPYCNNTPYEDYVNGIKDAKGPNRMKELAIAERDFLISLLPEGETPRCLS